MYIYKICFKKLQKLIIKYFPDDQLDLTIEELVTENVEELVTENVEHQNIITLFTKVTKFSEKGWNFLKCCYLLYLCVL